jgi:hypothetical protein
MKRVAYKKRAVRPVNESIRQKPINGVPDG